MLEDIVERHEHGQPVLVGTIAVETSEYLSELLTRRGIDAQRPQREGARARGGHHRSGRPQGRGHDRDEHGRPRRRHHPRRQPAVPDPQAAHSARGSRKGATSSRPSYGAGQDDVRAEWERDHDEIIELGGLYVLATERHEARRIDNQLRGRSGRQGDPGESRFYLSAQDDLVRLFAGDRIHSIMQRFKIPDDQPMESGLLSKQIENAQKKVEEQNFVARKNVLKYDDVMNTQRQVIYEQRRRVLDGDDLSDEIRQWIEEVVAYERGAVHRRRAGARNGTSTGLVGQMQALYGTDMTVEELREEVELTREALIEEFVEDALDTLRRARGDLRRRSRRRGQPVMREIERFVILQVVDTRWREHLENMDYLREGVHLRAMAQKDPLVEYRAEGHVMFEELSRLIREEVVLMLFHVELAPADVEQLQPAAQQQAAAPVRARDRRRRGRDRRRRRQRRRRHRARPSAPRDASRRSSTNTATSAATTPAGAAPARSSSAATALRRGEPMVPPRAPSFSRGVAERGWASRRASPAPAACVVFQHRQTYARPARRSPGRPTVDFARSRRAHESARGARRRSRAA